MADLIDRQEAIRIASGYCHPANVAKELAKLPSAQPEQRWIRCDQPPQDERNVFLAHGTNGFKSCCIGHYDHSMKKWYEDKNWFASPIYDCKYWCDIPDLQDMGDKQFEMPEPYEEMEEGER